MGGTSLPRNRFSSPASSGGGSGFDVQDEGSVVVSNPTFINFVGPGVTASPSGGGVDINISGSGGGLNFAIEHPITLAELSAKQFSLPSAPGALPFFADIINGAPLRNGVDYTISGNIFSWSGLGLDGVVAAGDVIRVVW